MTRGTYHVDGLTYIVCRDYEYTPGTYRWRLGLQLESCTKWEAHIDLPKETSLDEAAGRLLGPNASQTLTAVDF